MEIETFEGYMRNFILFLIFSLFSLEVFSGTCTSVSRTNNSANTVLTSTKYNTDLNTLYTAHNAFDGGCITDGTLESGALNSTDFAFLNKGIHQGCKVTRSNASTISVDKCSLSLDGNFISTTSANTESFGCTGCSTEATSTSYYIYVKPDSTGTTMNLLLLTSAPNNDGFDGSGNRAIGKFYNDSSGDIDQYSFSQWFINDFKPTDTDWTDAGATVLTGATSDPSKGTTTTDKVRWRRVGADMHIRYEYRQTSAGTTGTGYYLLEIPGGVSVDSSKITFYGTGTGTTTANYMINAVGSGNISTSVSSIDAAVSVYAHDSTHIAVNAAHGSADGNWGSGFVPMDSTSLSFAFTIIVPIEGWD